MATEIILKVDGNFLLVTDDSNGNVLNLPLSSTSYEIFIPQEVDGSSPDNKTYLFFTNLDGSKRKTGGWDIFCQNNNYYFSLYGEGNFPTLQTLIDYLDDNLATSLLPYRVFSALLTQSGISNVSTISSGTLTKGVSYSFSGTGGSSVDFSNVGVMNPIDGGAFIATETAAPTNWDGWSVSYDSGAPVVTVLENTIGNIWFTYDSVGSYIANSDSSFTLNKTLSFSSVSTDSGNPDFITIQNNNVNSVSIRQFDFTGVGLDGIDAASIEIKVYK